MSLSAADWCLLLATLPIALGFGSQAFFALVVGPATRRTGEAAVAELMGHVHQRALRVMPASYLVACLVIAGVGASSEWGGARWWLCGAALALIAADMAITILGNLPVIRVLIAAAHARRTPPDLRALQRRWDRYNAARALVALPALAALVLALRA